MNRNPNIREADLLQSRAEEKQISRDEDARALAIGEKSAEDLRAENGKFAFPEAIVDWSGARRLW